MNTVCTTTKFTCQMPGGDRRRIEADFSGGTITSDAGILLVDQANRVTGMTDRLAQCFEDTRAQHLVVHDVATLVGQRVFGLALGYEDLNDHDTLRHDQALGATLGQLEPGRAVGEQKPQGCRRLRSHGRAHGEVFHREHQGATEGDRSRP